MTAHAAELYHDVLHESGAAGRTVAARGAVQPSE
jgi:hypothetical protein